jgi:hypothetical protein
MYTSRLARLALTEEHLVPMEWEAVWAPDHRLNVLEKRKMSCPYRDSNHDSPNKFSHMMTVVAFTLTYKSWRLQPYGCDNRDPELDFVHH